MRIAISATAPSPEATVDPRLGRARYLLIFDSQTNSWEEIDNQQNLNAPGGAGVAVAERLAENRVAVVLTGACGPKALEALRAARIEVKEETKGTVTQALEAFMTGQGSTD